MTGSQTGLDVCCGRTATVGKEGVGVYGETAYACGTGGCAEEGDWDGGWDGGGGGEDYEVFRVEGVEDFAGDEGDCGEGGLLFDGDGVEIMVCGMVDRYGDCFIVFSLW